MVEQGQVDSILFRTRNKITVSSTISANNAVVDEQKHGASYKFTNINCYADLLFLSNSNNMPHAAILVIKDAFSHYVTLYIIKLKNAHFVSFLI